MGSEVGVGYFEQNLPECLVDVAVDALMVDKQPLDVISRYLVHMVFTGERMV